MAIYTPTDLTLDLCDLCCVHHLLCFVLFFISSLLNVLNTCFLSSLCLFNFLSSSFSKSFLCSSIRFLVAAFSCFCLWLYDTLSIFISEATYRINNKKIMTIILTHRHTLIDAGFLLICRILPCGYLLYLESPLYMSQRLGIHLNFIQSRGYMGPFS